jgi:hypothetical protein
MSGPHLNSPFDPMPAEHFIPPSPFVAAVMKMAAMYFGRSTTGVSAVANSLLCITEGVVVADCLDDSAEQPATTSAKVSVVIRTNCMTASAK